MVSGASQPYQPLGSQLPIHAGPFPRAHPITQDTQTRDLLAYIFSPPEPASAHLNGSRASAQNPAAYNEWGPLGYRLAEDNFRIEFALDLVEVFFQIVHSRLPLLNPAQFRSRLHYSLYATGSQPQVTNDGTPQGGAGYRGRNSNSPPHGGPQQKPVHPALVAVVVAWGAKFSEHPLFVADRHQNRNQSVFAKVLINRARDLAEDMKVHRVPSADHVVIALLIEPLQSQSVEDNAGFHGFWLGSAIRLLLDLQINHKSVMSNIQDPEARGTMIFAWWMACLADAYRSVYYRRKPMLDDDDYDIDFYTVGPDSHPFSLLLTRDPLGVDQGYYRAAHALARIARQMSRQLWRPATESDGIPLDVLNGFMSMLSDWREEHLQHVGVPSNFEAEWDFVSAVTACASDATYHIMWIILQNALEDFGIREVTDVTRTGTSETLLPQHAQIEEKKRKVSNEALHGALRIAGLAGVLASNGYLVRPGSSVSDPRVRHR
uniref:Zn(2)-C6 fungal-type domain-containing protein n=1 Tax=Ganoderma boninense TaxID=34458 RepID=A0A5K1JSP2_9APHY|nr:Zn(2)-C6 fungal-type domain-containing protein [Ganoderma boninense]